VRDGVTQLAFVAAPALLMAVMLTARPTQALRLCQPPWWSWPAACVLAAAILPPMTEAALGLMARFPALLELLKGSHPVTREVISPGRPMWQLILVFAVLPAVCEELAFRGFILTGLLRGFRPLTAVLVSSFLFALSQLNGLLFAPWFVVGVVLGILVVRSGSVLPAMLMRLVLDGLILLPTKFKAISGLSTLERVLISAVSLAACALALWAVWRLGRRTPLPGEPA
jgi:sodium transport system permease protein